MKVLRRLTNMLPSQEGLLKFAPIASFVGIPLSYLNAFEVAYGQRGCVPTIPTPDSVLGLCAAVSLLNIYYLMRRSGSPVGRFVMAIFVAITAGTYIGGVTPRFAQRGGYFERVRVQQADGTWHEPYRRHAAPFMEP